MKYLLAVLCTAIAGLCLAQGKSLPIAGEPFPYTGTLVVNGSTKQTISVTSLKGENIILDLFGSGCVVCFQMLPKINTFQKEFRGKMRFLLIGQEDGKIAGTYKKFKDKLGLELDVAFDSTLFKHIQYDFFPTYIWIHKSGKVAAVTGPSDLTHDNISRFVAGDPLSFGNVAEKTVYESAKAYLIDGNGGPDSNYLVRSLLGKWNPSLPYSMPLELTYTEAGKNFNTLGVSKEHLYKYAYWGRAYWTYGDSLYEEVWPEPILLNETDDDCNEMKVAQTYCYTAAYKGDHAPDLAQVLRNDLRNFFGYEVEIVKRRMPYWKVSLVNPCSSQLRSKDTSTNYRKKSHAGFEYRNVSFSKIVSMLAYYDTSVIPYIDKTGIDYPVDIKVEALLTERTDFFRGLKEAGILVEPDYRFFDVMILRRQKDVAAK